jgi:hypothetical protein
MFFLTDALAMVGEAWSSFGRLRWVFAGPAGIMLISMIDVLLGGSLLANAIWILLALVLTIASAVGLLMARRAMDIWRD